MLEGKVAILVSTRLAYIYGRGKNKWNSNSAPPCAIVSFIETDLFNKDWPVQSTRLVGKHLKLLTFE